MSSPSLSVADSPETGVHFVGVAGTGMSALAQHRALAGGRTSGSDRSFDRGELTDARSELERAGVSVHPQDGSGAADADLVVTSTAVEAEIPDVAVARDRGVLVHRAEMLAWLVEGRPSVALAGTSGKSTATAMVFEVLRGSGADPSLITGGDLRVLRESGMRGNAWAGTGPLVLEADESDGSLVRYAPAIGTVLNLHRDHMEPSAVLEQFRTFAARTRTHLLVADDAALRELRSNAIVFGFGPDAQWRGRDLHVGPEGSRFLLDDVPVTVPIPGRHNAENALAALCTARAAGVDLAAGAAALATYAGVCRRFEILGRRGGVEVIDDYAHNPTKVAAALRAAQLRSPRVHAVFQPHGFGPTRFMRAELTDLLAAALRPEDRLWIAPIYFAGGSVQRDVSSADLVADAQARDLPVHLLEERSSWPARMAADARPGDAILVLGGRDPTLGAFAQDVLDALPGPAEDARGAPGAAAADAV